MISISNRQLYSPCPCGSGKKAKFCCAESGAWHKEPIRLNQRPADSYAHPKCYARGLGQCSKKLTREHFISDNVLRQLGCGTNTIDIFGFAFQQSQPQSISISSLTRRMLCENHNNLLSPLDDAAGRFFEASLRIIEDFQQAPAVSLFAGEDIELWMLKTLIGIIESGQSSIFTDAGIERSSFTLDPVCSKILFQKSPWPAGWGVYVDRGISPSNGHFFVSPNVEDNKVTGAHFRICGKQFFLSLGARHVCDPPYGIIKPIGTQARLFRPTILSHLRGSDTRQIILTWNGLTKESFWANRRLCTLVWAPESEKLPPEDLSSLFSVIGSKPKT